VRLHNEYNLSGKNGNAIPHDRSQRTDGLLGQAAAKGCTPAQLALAWLLAQDNVIPIPGTSSAVRLQENVDAMNVTLTREELDRIDRVPHRGVASGQRYDARWGSC
jgi:aryl-alcohol dehydrogenase-like predicted oxidoreductase